MGIWILILDPHQLESLQGQILDIAFVFCDSPKYYFCGKKS